MPKVTLAVLDHASDPVRRPIYEVLGIQNVGASPRGSTFYKTAQICPREWALKYIVGFSPESIAEALTVGWLWHYCLQLYYEAIWLHQRATPNRPSSLEWLWGGSQKGMTAAYAVLDKLAAEPGYADTVSTARRCADAYFEMYDRKDRWRILGCEETVRFTDGSFDYSARLDLIVEDLERGGTRIVEHKTARAITEDLLGNYQMDLQILGQAWLLPRCIDTKCYPPFQGVTINLCTKHKTPQLHRHDVHPSPAHLLAFERTVASHAHLRRTAAALGYPQFFGHCSGYARGYSSCDFFELCHNHPEIGVAQWQQLAPPPNYQRHEERTL